MLSMLGLSLRIKVSYTKLNFKGRIRKGNEPLPELAHDLKRLVRRAYPDLTNSMRDIIAKD